MNEAITPSDFWRQERDRQKREEVGRQRKPLHVTGIPRLAALRSGIDPERIRRGVHDGCGWEVDIQGVTDAEKERYRVSFRLGAIALGYSGDAMTVTVRGV